MGRKGRMRREWRRDGVLYGRLVWVGRRERWDKAVKSCRKVVDVSI